MVQAQRLCEQRSFSATWPGRLGMLRERREDFSVGVTPVQAGILLYLLQHPGSYIRQCARAFGVTGPAVGVTVRALEQKRWVIKRRAPQDDRYVLLTPTQHGSALADKTLRLL